MTGREEIVAAARRWIGTPYCHQASIRGAGTDCLGLLRGIWREVLGSEPEPTPAYSEDWSEPSGKEELLAAASRVLVRIDTGTVAPGDVLIFRMRAGMVAKHIGIIGQTSPISSFIHAYSGHGVVESALSEPWARRIAGQFQFPSGA